MQVHMRDHIAILNGLSCASVHRVLCSAARESDAKKLDQGPQSAADTGLDTKPTTVNLGTDAKAALQPSDDTSDAKPSTKPNPPAIHPSVLRMVPRSVLLALSAQRGDKAVPTPSLSATAIDSSVINAHADKVR